MCRMAFFVLSYLHKLLDVPFSLEKEKGKNKVCTFCTSAQNGEISMWRPPSNCIEHSCLVHRNDDIGTREFALEFREA